MNKKKLILIFIALSSLSFADAFSEAQSEIIQAVKNCCDDSKYNNPVNLCHHFANRLNHCINKTETFKGHYTVVTCPQTNTRHSINRICDERMCCLVEPQGNECNSPNVIVLNCRWKPKNLSQPILLPDSARAILCAGAPGDIDSVATEKESKMSNSLKKVRDELLYPNPKVCSERYESPINSMKTATTQSANICAACVECCRIKFEGNPIGIWFRDCVGWCNDRLRKSCDPLVCDHPEHYLPVSYEQVCKVTPPASVPKDETKKESH